MEGLFHPDQFTFPATIDKGKVLKSIVKIRPIRTLEYNLFQTEEEADKFCETLIDEKGFETIQYGFTDKNKTQIDDPEFSQALFTYEFCELLKSNASFPAKTPLLGHGTGFFISTDGYIATNFHLVSGAVAYLNGEDGYFDSENQHIHNIEIEYPVSLNGSMIEYKKASKVFLAGTYSKKDAYGKRLDLAILKIDESASDFIPLSKTQPSRFDQIYSIGFSMRTSRKEDRKKLLGYEDAQYDLRI